MSLRGSKHASYSSSSSSSPPPSSSSSPPVSSSPPSALCSYALSSGVGPAFGGWEWNLGRAAPQTCGPNFTLMGSGLAANHPSGSNCAGDPFCDPLAGTGVPLAYELDAWSEGNPQSPNSNWMPRRWRGRRGSSRRRSRCTRWKGEADEHPPSYCIPYLSSLKRSRPPSPCLSQLLSFASPLRTRLTPLLSNSIDQPYDRTVSQRVGSASSFSKLSSSRPFPSLHRRSCLPSMEAAAATNPIHLPLILSRIISFPSHSTRSSGRSPFNAVNRASARRP